MQAGYKLIANNTISDLILENRLNCHIWYFEKYWNQMRQDVIAETHFVSMHRALDGKHLGTANCKWEVYIIQLLEYFQAME